MATLTVGVGQEFTTVSSAVAAAASGDVVLVNPGTYVDDFPVVNNDITIVGNTVSGGVVTLEATPDVSVSGILTVNANVTVENIAFTGATSSDGNGAGIRYQSGNLTINNCNFYGNQDGLLANASTGTITVNNSEFSNNGVSDKSSPGYGLTHNLYVNQIASLVINNSLFTDPIVGHDIKSRALNTTIENSRILDPNGTGSYQIDLPNGGNATIENNVLEKGPGAGNNVFISSGEEGATNPTSTFTVSGNTVINNYGSGATMVVNDTTATASITSNTTYGLVQAQLAGGSGPASFTPANSLYPIADAPPLDTTPPFLPPAPLPCFVAGTRILTGAGNVPVESLRVGQEIVAVESGQRVSRRVKWIGSCKLNMASHPAPELVSPVRIRRGAFAQGVPQRDLFLSPDHAVFVDGMLIPARLLANGGTIAQEVTRRRVLYYHVELDAHGVILAEGLPCESYLDTGNRAVFAAGDAPATDPVALHPVFVAPTALRWGIDACAPLATSEAEVGPIWRRLAHRSASAGLPPPNEAATSDPDVRLVMDDFPLGKPAGDSIRPVVTDADRHVFVLPRGVTRVRIVSRCAVPAAATPPIDDRRRLGIGVQRIILECGADRLEMAMDDPALGAGWWAVEREGTRQWRWTNGNAALTLPEGTLRLELQVAAEMRYPAEAEAEQEQPAAA